MEIDDDNKLSRYSKKRTVESDHNPVYLHMKMKLPILSATRVEIYNFKNPESLALFKEETSKNSKLSDCFTKSQDFQLQVESWRKRFDSSIKKCFKQAQIVHSCVN